jgi:glycoprotein-N-acetylgalactosamine 3-beta-galactosyltransferase
LVFCSFFDGVISQKCDGFLVASNLTDMNIGTTNIPHEGEEDYYNMWQKVRSMWSFAYDNYYDKYDWFHVGGDDMYLIVENLRLYLESDEIRTASNGGVFLPTGSETKQTPLYMGRRFAFETSMDDIYNSGGPGYTLNKAALKTLVVNGLPQFNVHEASFAEDLVIGRMLRKLGVYPYETKDESGGERYMPFTPSNHYSYRKPLDPSSYWYTKFSIDIKEGYDHFANYSVAFHYIKGTEMKRYHALLYGLCSEIAV